MDLGEVTAADGVSRKFAISSGIGIDADVCKQALTSKLKNFLNAIHLGSATYGILTVKTLFSMPLADGVAHVDGVEDFPLKNMIRTRNIIWLQWLKIIRTYQKQSTQNRC